MPGEKMDPGLSKRLPSAKEIADLDRQALISAEVVVTNHALEVLEKELAVLESEIKSAKAVGLKDSVKRMGERKRKLEETISSLRENRDSAHQRASKEMFSDEFLRKKNNNQNLES